MNTLVYVKMDAPEPLLLSEGVCRQLGIVTYHPDIQTNQSSGGETSGRVPTVRVQLVQGVKLPPNPDQNVVAEACLGSELSGSSLLLESSPKLFEDVGVQMADMLVLPSAGFCSSKVHTDNGSRH